MQWAALRACQGLADHGPGPLDRLLHIPRLRRAGVQDHPTGADALAHAQGLDQRSQRLLADLAIVGSAIEQVDRMDQDYLDGARLHRVAEGLKVVLVVRRGPPHPWRLVENLDRVASPLDAALDRFWQAACLRDMGAD